MSEGSAPGAAAPAGLAAEVAKARWYHTMELPGGIVTPGDYDLPDTARRIPLPRSLAGLRCLDVGTRDGFWAFEMERRGAAEVVGIDVEDPALLDFPLPRPEIEDAGVESLERRDLAFSVAHRALGSKVQRRLISVYDITPEEIGEFDFAFIGTILLHLRNPVDALAAVRGVLRTGARLMSNDAISIPLTLLRPAEPAAEVAMQPERPFWYVPNLAGRRRMVEAAGFEIESAGGPYLMRYGAGWQQPAHPRTLTRPGMMLQRLVLRRGAPHSWLIARPRG
ncbi:MAG: methyltransferase domain-containing protein [Thermoleophilaceae bacterium]|nr:methyltransferase domain-containing protein [Thermoleophilaceae bacterium]